jgi:hypothetical protein
VANSVVGIAVWAAIVAVQAAIMFRARNLPLPARAALVFTAFPAVGAFLALVAGLATGYWR